MHLPLLPLLPTLLTLSTISSAFPLTATQAGEAAPWEPPKLIVTSFHADETPGSARLSFHVEDTSPEHPLNLTCSVPSITLFRNEWVPCDGGALRGSKAEVFYWFSEQDFALQRVFRLVKDDAKSLVIGYTERKATNWVWGTNKTSLLDGLDSVYEREEEWEFPIRRIDSRK